MNNAQLKYEFFCKYGRKPSNFADVVDTASVIQDAFKLSPEAAVRFFEQKGYKITWDWKSVAASFHKQAFTVAKVMQADLLQFFKSEIQTAIKDGTTYADFKKNITARLNESGWKGSRMVTDSKTGKVTDLASPAKLKTIYQTNLQSSYMNGRYEQMKETVKTHPYGMYFNSDAKSEICKAVNGKIVRLDDKNLRLPPLHYNCKTTLDPISEKEAKRNGYVVESAEKVIKHGGGVQESFDSHPDEKWQPDTTKYDGDIAEQLLKTIKK